MVLEARAIRAAPSPLEALRDYLKLCMFLRGIDDG